MKENRLTLLFVEDDPGLGRQLKWAFADLAPQVANDRESALAIARKMEPKVVVLDLGLPPDTQGVSEGLRTLETLRSELPHSKVIIMSGNEDRGNAMRAISLGAYDFCQKPMDLEILKLIIDRALNLFNLEDEARIAQRERTNSPLRGLITCAPNMLDICAMVERVAPTDVTVMLLGESGTGKEVLARALHDLSPRADRPFVAINCGAIPENLLESELFGHEKGSFTGAVRQVIGKIETANGGTLFLDEIGDLPAQLQVKLLRFLQERVIERIGGRQQIPVDVRVVCATNKNIDEEGTSGQFRSDLFYRLNEFCIRIPPLREREGDPEVLAHYFLNLYNSQYNRQIRGFDSGALRAIREYPWPGNIRELQSQVKRATLMAQGEMITEKELALPQIAAASPAGEEDGGLGVDYRGMTLKEVRTEAERAALRQALARAEGNISRAAKMLGVSRPTMYSLMQVHDIRT
ncbi:MAG: PEP-CTERM-box response regulator transcription factor [Alphaproteobacteria bacterium]|nr:PEP-CTERM-box response regulator transcription factor [Alphaproteobacteria bacterium]